MTLGNLVVAVTTFVGHSLAAIATVAGTIVGLLLLGTGLGLSSVAFNDIGTRKLVVVVLLTGGKPAIGPAAAGIAGDIYRRLDEQRYFAANAPVTPASLVGSQICCK